MAAEELSKVGQKARNRRQEVGDEMVDRTDTFGRDGICGRLLVPSGSPGNGTIVLFVPISEAGKNMAL